MEAIEWLESQGVQVISMSKTWFAGSMDGTSDLDRFIEQSAGRGVTWVIAAGNFAEGHYLGEFSDPDGDGYHEFSDGNEALQIYPEESVTLALNWDDWQVGDQDYDLYLLDGDQNVVASSENRQNGPDSGAYELINASGLDPNGTYYVAFYGYHVTRPAQLNFFVLHGKLDGSMPETSISMPAESESGAGDRGDQLGDGRTGAVQRAGTDAGWAAEAGPGGAERGEHRIEREPFQRDFGGRAACSRGGRAGAGGLPGLHTRAGVRLSEEPGGGPGGGRTGRAIRIWAAVAGRSRMNGTRRRGRSRPQRQRLLLGRPRLRRPRPGSR